MLKNYTKLAYNYTIHNEEGNQFRELLPRKQKSELDNHLHSCNKTALVLPVYMCNRHLKDLERNGLGADTGKVRYFVSYHVFWLSGLVLPNTVIRIGRYRASGLADWWQHFFPNIYNIRVKNAKYPEKCSITGNIVVLFYMYLLGCAIALVIFLVKIFPKIIRRFKLGLISLTDNHILQTRPTFMLLFDEFEKIEDYKELYFQT